MPKETAAIFRLLEPVSWLKDFVLIGGTALSLHLGHRQSEDLDFITPLPKLSRAELRNVEELIRDAGHTIAQAYDPDAYDDFLNAGMDIRDYSQTWIIDGVVKLTFFTAEEHHRRLLEKEDTRHSFRVAKLSEIAALKAIVICERSKSRDWLDLFILEKDFHFGIRNWKEAYDKAGLTSAHFETGLKRICSGILQKSDEGFTMLLPDAPPLQEITSHFKALREIYEISLARETLSQQRGTKG